MSILSAHAAQRITERIMAEGIDSATTSAIIERISRVASQYPTVDVAYRIGRLTSGMVGRPWSDRSNGDTLWAIIRHGRIETVLWRRSTQPSTVDALRVDIVR